MNRDAVCNNQMPVNVMLQGHPGCLTAEALVCTEDGQLVRIGELINPMRSVGIYIVDLPVFPPARANALHLYDVYNTVEITTKSGRRVRVTPNHPLMTADGWLEASNIKAGERLRIYSKLPSPQKYVPVIISLSERARLATRSPNVKMPEYFSPELGEYVGIWVAEGHAEIGVSTKRIGFAICQDEEELTNRIVELTKSLFNVEAVVNDWKPVETKPGYFTKVRQIRVRYAEVADFFFPMWRSSRGDEPKNVPTPILLSPKSVSAAFLRGLFEGDGSVYFHKGVEKKRNNYRVALKSASRQLCEEVQILLLRHGIYSSIYQGTNFRLGKTHDSYSLVIRRKQNLELFRD
jgi:ribonucleoside-diphosphate reductase alpha chain